MLKNPSMDIAAKGVKPIAGYKLLIAFEMESTGPLMLLWI